jgi:hypothetical protein
MDLSNVIEIKITEDQRERGRELYKFNVLRGSVTKGEGNKVGALGEILVWDRYKKVTEYVGNFDFDLLIKGKKVDVKTKKQNIPPATHHSCNIFAKHKKQKCDYYCFVFIHVSMETGWIVGWKEKEKFYAEATFREKGEIDDTLNTTWEYKDDCYTMKIVELE